ncbi:TorF family putative porin [Nibricoccus sp. IMCC34717]|uniref:TorF family putative porin n=1 Tax=Nibricoccus sp. IMCC34717 TaxID=3034021 RepID=UPI00384D314F
MKKTILLLAALSVAAGLRAEEAKSTYSVTTDFSYTSKYVFRGLKLTDEAFQPSVEVSAGDAYIGVWTSQPVTKNQSNEVDVYGGYKFKASEELTFEAVGTYYLYPEARSGQVHESYEAGVGATYTVAGISTTVNAYYDFRLEAQTYQASVGYSLPIKDLGTSLDFTVNYGVVGAKNFDTLGQHESYNYWGADVSLPYKLSEKATAVAAVHYGDTRQIAVSGDSDNIWYSLGISVGF